MRLNLDYSRVEVMSLMKFRWGWSDFEDSAFWWVLRSRREKRRRMALRIWTEHKPYLNFISARLKGKKMAIKIENKNTKIVQIVVLEKILSITETKW